MRQTFDFAPLFGSTVGFDRVFDLLQSATRGQPTQDNYPPYDIERTGPDAYRIVMAIAGFRDNEVSIVAERNQLLVTGEREAASGDDKREFLHRGIGARTFRQQFQLADYVKVNAATLRDGLLTIDLVREIPEVMRPRRIEISGQPNIGASQQIEAQRAA